MNRFANLADRRAKDETVNQTAPASPVAQVPIPPSRVGRKAISGYFVPEVSLALRTCALRHGRSLQDLMAEAFDDVLRKYGESPIGQ